MRKNEKIAYIIAREVMTAVNGQVAERLVLWLDSENRDLGGWSHAGLANLIQVFLDVSDEPKRQRTTAQKLNRALKSTKPLVANCNAADKRRRKAKRA